MGESLSPDLIIHAEQRDPYNQRRGFGWLHLVEIKGKFWLRTVQRLRGCRLGMLLFAMAPLLAGCVPQTPAVKSPAKSPLATAPPLKPATPTVASSNAGAAPLPPPARPLVQALIDQVEAAYQSGVTQYHAGKLQTAKTDFDHAVDLMLSSNFDMRNEPQLRDEFDRILDAVNTLELEALKRGKRVCTQA